MADSIVQKKSFEFALEIIKLYQKLQEKREYVISKQLLRSGASISGSNFLVAEASLCLCGRAHLHLRRKCRCRDAHPTVNLDLLSIGANVEEALAGQSRKDFLSKMSIASKEARETHYWLRLLQASDLVDVDVSQELKHSDELIRILTSIVKTTGQKS
jgi:hypothetical protein